LLRPRFGGA